MAALLAIATVLALQPALATYEPNIFFNWSVSIASPMVSPFYALKSYNTTENNVTFDGVSVPYPLGVLGMGDAHLYMNISPGERGNQLRFDYKGEDFKIFGAPTILDPTSNLSISLDDSPVQYYPPEDNNVLAKASVRWGHHNLLVVPVGPLRIDSFTFLTGMQTQAPSFEDVDMSVEYFVLSDSAGGARNPFFSYRGEWNVFTQLGRGVDGQAPLAYPTLIGHTPSGQVNISVPANTSFVVINGTVGPDYGPYELHFFPPTPGDQQFRNTTPGQDYYSCLNPWIAPVMMNWMPLDPAIEYTISLTLSPQSSLELSPVGMGLHSVTFYSGLSNKTAPPTDQQVADQAADNKAKKSNKNKIIGGTVGGIGGALLVILAMVLAWRRYTRHRRHLSEVDAYKGDDSPKEAHDPPLLPFVSTSMAPAGYSNVQLAASDTPETPPPQPARVSEKVPIIKRVPVPADRLSIDSTSEEAVAPTSPSSTTRRPLPALPTSSASGRPLPDLPAPIVSPSDRWRPTTQPPATRAGPSVERIPPRYNPQWQNASTSAQVAYTDSDALSDFDESSYVDSYTDTPYTDKSTSSAK